MLRTLLALFLLSTALHAATGGSAFLTKDEALSLAFRDCKVSSETVYLTKEQRTRIEKLAGHALGSGIVRPYVAKKDGKITGIAFFDTHKVRTLKESLMIVISADGKVSRIEMLAFGEPTEYIPRDSWYAQFDGKRLEDRIELKKGIRGVTGATLTARATTKAVRRVLAIHRVLFEGPAPVAP